MSTTAIPTAEFEQEMRTTRRLIERVPDDRSDWKPHEKSFSVGHLAQLLAWMPGWIGQTLRQDAIDLAGGASYSYEPISELLALFDRNVAEATTALNEVTGGDLQRAWSLKMGDHVLMTQPRGEAVRGHLNHLIHHRGQMSVYLRLLDVPVPSIYGPTADERWPMPGAQ
jgi:uncharacterized damage-inducible protein DinB